MQPQTQNNSYFVPFVQETESKIYLMQTNQQNLTFISFQMTKILIPYFVVMEQMYKCYNASRDTV